MDFGIGVGCDEVGDDFNECVFVCVVFVEEGVDFIRM